MKGGVWRVKPGVESEWSVERSEVRIVECKCGMKRVN